MPEVIAGILAIVLGIGVLIVRYRRAERLIAFMPLVPLGFGLIVVGLLLVLRADPEWIALVAVGSVLVALRRTALALLWTGRISAHVAALTYAAILPVAFLAFVWLQRPGFPGWPALGIAGLLFLISYAMAVLVLPHVEGRLGKPPSKSENP